MEEKVIKSQFAALASRVKQHDEDLRNLRNEFKNKMDNIPSQSVIYDSIDTESLRLENEVCKEEMKKFHEERDSFDNKVWKVLTNLCGNAVKISEKMEMVHATFFVINDTFGKMADAFNSFIDTINQLINVLKANALSISGVEVELDNLKDEIRNQKNFIDTIEISIMHLTASVNSIREAIKKREAVTVYVPQTNVSQPWYERMTELSKMPVLKNPYFITLAVVILLQFGFLFYTISVIKEQRAEIANIKQDNSEIVKLYHRQSYIFDRIEKMDETVGKLAAEKSKKSSSIKKR